MTDKECCPKCRSAISRKTAGPELECLHCGFMWLPLAARLAIPHEETPPTPVLAMRPKDGKAFNPKDAEPHFPRYVYKGLADETAVALTEMLNAQDHPMGTVYAMQRASASARAALIRYRQALSGEPQ